MMKRGENWFGESSSAKRLLNNLATEARIRQEGETEDAFRIGPVVGAREELPVGPSSGRASVTGDHADGREHNQ